jgi:4-diphosphocytidyl-2-C-methyl-D-erythritol kinase
VVTGRRPDGLHQLRSLMVSISLCDLVFIEPGGSHPSDPSGPYAEAARGGEDLATRAWSVLGGLVTAAPDAVVSVHKRIPAGAGLGGGSADAAAVLRLAYSIDPALSRGSLESAAMSLGADIPFQLQGGAALVSGAGEEIVSLPTRSLDLAVCWPGIHAATGTVFGHVGPGDMGAGTEILEAARAWRSVDVRTLRGLVEALPNGLWSPALRAYPALEEVRGRLAGAGWRPKLTGSGSSFFTVCRDPVEALALAGVASSAGYAAWAVATIPPLALPG